MGNYCTPEAFVFNDGNSSNNALTTAALMNGGMGGGMWNNPIWAIVFLAALRNGGLFGNNGWDGNGAHPCTTSQLTAIQETLNSNHGQTLLMDAIKGNQSAISQLASTINCNYNAVQTAINGVQSAICGVGNQVGMGQMQIINAVQNGDSGIINALQSCCCDMKNTITNLNYEGRLADQAQTAFLGGKIDQQTTLINDKFCQMEMREMQDKLDNERSKNLALTNQLSQEHQNATFAAMLAPIKADIDEIKCKQPATVTVPYSPVTPVPSCVAWNAALYGGYGYPFGINNGQWS